MPKMKTHKGTAKRVKVTGSGKIMVRPMEPKRMKRRRQKLYRIRGNVPASSAVERAIRTNLPYTASQRPRAAADDSED